jgi:hypothetical protein
MKRLGYVRFTPLPRNAAETRVEESADEAALCIDLPSDVEAALSYLRRRAHEHSSVTQRDVRSHDIIAPLSLKHHLYDAIINRNEVDQEVEALSQRNSIRLFRLTATTEIAVARTGDYQALISHLAESTPRISDVLARYAAALDVCTGVSVSHASLADALKSSDLPNVLWETSKGDVKSARKRSKPEAKFKGSELVNADDDISVLVQVGLLRARELRDYDAQAYWFSSPHLGPFTASLVNGRVEIRAMLKRARRKELLRHDMDKKRLRKSHLGIRFHIVDLVTRDEAVEIATSTGPLIKLRL